MFTSRPSTVHRSTSGPTAVTVGADRAARDSAADVVVCDGAVVEPCAAALDGNARATALTQTPNNCAGDRLVQRNIRTLIVASERHGVRVGKRLRDIPTFMIVRFAVTAVPSARIQRPVTGEYRRWQLTPRQRSPSLL